MRSLEIFIEKVKKVWGPLSSETVAQCKGLLEDLVNGPSTKTWLIDSEDARLLPRTIELGECVHDLPIVAFQANTFDVAL